MAILKDEEVNITDNEESDDEEEATTDPRKRKRDDSALENGDDGGRGRVSNGNELQSRFPIPMTRMRTMMMTRTRGRASHLVEHAGAMQPEMQRCAWTRKKT